MRTLYLAMEIAPPFVVGGLGLTAAGLPSALAAGHGLEHTVLVPYYTRQAAVRGLRTTEVAKLPALGIGGITTAPTLLRWSDHSMPIEVLMLRADPWYNRPGGIYRDAGYVRYPDVVARAGFFGRAVATWLGAGGRRYDLVHANDWQTATALLHMRCTEANPPVLLYDVHNGRPGGDLGGLSLAAAGIPHVAAVELARSFHVQPDNLMAIGVWAADEVVTCSPAYARELKASYIGTALGNALARKRISGIVNGIDPADWPLPYNASQIIVGKLAAKRVLQRELGLREDTTVPLFMCCGRLVADKGLDLILAVVPGLVRAGRMQLAVMGNGEKRYIDAFASLARAVPTAVALRPHFESTAARRLYAGADFTLMPSLVEPCGINQLIALRYGTLPVVHAVGGLRDTVVDIAEYPDDGDGLRFDAPTPTALHATLERALVWWTDDPAGVMAARARAMCRDWTWARCAEQFAHFYAELMRTYADRGRQASGEHDRNLTA